MTAYWGLRLFTNSYCTLKISGAQHIPEGGTLIAANHKSLLDPPLLSYALKLSGRDAYFLGKKELFENPILGGVLRAVGSIPLDRKAADVGALKTALGVLERGDILALFPEGTRKVTGRLERFLPGIGFLALKSRVPVVPVYISDFGSFPAPGKVINIRLGTPVPYEEIAKYDAKEIAQIILEAVRRLSHEQ